MLELSPKTFAPLRVACWLDPARPDLDEELAQIPDQPAVYWIAAGEGTPMLGRTNVVGRRLRRLLRPATGQSRLLNLRTVATAVAYWPVASRLEASLLLYAVAQEKAPDRYLKLINLRLPTYIKLLVNNQFPRTTLSTRLTRNGFYFGPFRNRLSAEAFETRVLELFQVRRCQEDLEPSPEHPGCIYGEMNQCLRPCQAAVSPEEYATESKRLAAFFSSNGESMLEALAKSRDQLSQEMQFEAAMRQHKRLERVQTVVREREELAGLLGQHQGVAVLPAVEPNAVTLFFLADGIWSKGHVFRLEGDPAKPMSMDARLNEIVRQIQESPSKLVGDASAKAEHLAILTRWHYSSWRDGEWLAFPSYKNVPYRKLVNAIARVSRLEKS